jgi:hypothetical protein
MLISYFKEKYKTLEYQKYLKRVKAPDTPFHQVQSEPYPQSPNFYSSKPDSRSPYGRSPYGKAERQYSPGQNKQEYNIKQDIYGSKDNYAKYERFRDGYQKEYGVKNEVSYGVKSERSPRREFYDRKRSRDYGDEKYE